MFSTWPKSGGEDEQHALVAQAKKSLSTKQNSSRLYSGLAIIHNQASKESGGHLLAMPRSLQVIIFRFVLRNDKELIVNIYEPELCEEPDLLIVCKDIRAVALPLFYRETSFRCEPESFDVLALQPWVKKRERAMQPSVNLQEVGVMDETLFNDKSWFWRYRKQGQIADHLFQQANKRTAPPLPEPTILIWSIDDVSNWANLMKWLKLYHAEKIEGYEFGVRVQAKHKVLKSVFGVVRALRAQSWDVVLEVLKEARAALSAVDAGWSTGGNEYEKTQEVGFPTTEIPHAGGSDQEDYGGDGGAAHEIGEREYESDSSQYD